MALTNKLTAIGNAIRAKNGETALYTLDEMPQKIAAIEGGGGGSGSGVIGQLVPEDYQQVLYLQCDGSQYLISDYYPNGHTQIISQFYNNNSAQQPVRYMYGVRNEGDTASFSSPVIWYSKNNWRYGTQALVVENTSSNKGCYSIQGYTKQSNTANSGLIVADIGTGAIFGRGSYTVEEFQSELPMYILSCNVKGSADVGAQGNLYRMTIKENDVIVRDYIPCYRKSDSKPGLYDIVNKQFYTNAGSGEFSFPEYTI